MEENYREKYLALLAGVKPEMLDDAITLANSRVTEEVPFEAAVNDVMEKHPGFRIAANAPVSHDLPLSTGIRTGGRPNPLSGVEAAFLARNPDIKI
jgi:hypothetical protein